MKIKKIYEPVFFTNLLFLYDCTAFEAENYLRNLSGIKTRLEKCSGQTGSYIVMDNPQKEQKRYYIYIEKGKLNPEILVHEVSHLCFISLFDCGIKITEETDEVFSYYMEWWIKKLKSALFFKKSGKKVFRKKLS